MTDDAKTRTLTKALSTHEPPPTSTCQVYEESVQFQVGEDFPVLAEIIAARAHEGAKKYGTYLRPFNGRLWRLDGAQELLDALAYYRQGIMELEEQNKHRADIVADYHVLGVLARRACGLGDPRIPMQVDATRGAVRSAYAALSEWAPGKAMSGAFVMHARDVLARALRADCNRLGGCVTVDGKPCLRCGVPSA